MKNHTGKIIAAIILLVFGVGLGGAFFLFKEGKKQVIDYSLQLSEIIISKEFSAKRNESPKNRIKYLNQLSSLKGELHSDNVELESILLKLNTLFEESSFRVLLVDQLELSDKASKPISFTNWEKMKSQLNSQNGTQVFQAVWGNLIKVYAFRLQEGKNMNELSEEYFISLNPLVP